LPAPNPAPPFQTTSPCFGGWLLHSFNVAALASANFIADFAPSTWFCVPSAGSNQS
jgi:hypothetical protein